MHEAEGRFRGAGGLELAYRSWTPEGEPRAVVVLVHGVCEHCGRYSNLVGPLVADGYAVYGYDQRGHGISPGQRVHVDRWAEYREDLAAFARFVAGVAPGVPVVLYGHSMGSLVVLDYLLQKPEGVAGAVISGVPLEPAGVGSPALIRVARLLTGVVPRLPIDLGLDVATLSRDPDVVRSYRDDPLVTSRATVRWGTESLDTVRRVRAAMGAIDTPLLIVHGEADRLNLPDGARELFEAVVAEGKEIRIYPDVHHEPHNDLGHELLADDVRRWLARVTAAQAAGPGENAGQDAASAPDRTSAPG